MDVGQESEAGDVIWDIIGLTLMLMEKPGATVSVYVGLSLRPMCMYNGKTIVIAEPRRIPRYLAPWNLECKVRLGWTASSKLAVVPG